MNLRVLQRIQVSMEFHLFDDHVVEEVQVFFEDDVGSSQEATEWIFGSQLSVDYAQFIHYCVP